ncbi:GNAT family N-acetyltransferase [Klebsiella variicola]|uniref:GNAT family N-acetyltransferase n=1 Tax=Klebsiella variicola TaxID=244366 RepID=UPI00237902AD|nr:GNAT family N-acetyltransferase [Klebsiella variicola]MDD9256356.1 GNAT family N-acetyltransferase [Klebsiella variicola]
MGRNDLLIRTFPSLIIETIKEEAMARGLKQLTLTSTPNAQTFYEKHGFMFIKETTSPSRLAQTDLRCMDMSITL